MAEKPSKPRVELTEDQLAWAKQQYMNYVPIVHIAAQLGVDRNALQYHATQAKNSWKLERRLTEEELLGALAEGKQKVLTEITGSSLKIIANALKTVAANEEPSLRDAQIASNILEKIDRILRLDASSPTSITAEVKPTTRAEIIEVLRNADPFAKLAEKASEVVDHREIDDAIVDLNIERSK